MLEQQGRAAEPQVRRDIAARVEDPVDVLVIQRRRGPTERDADGFEAFTEAGDPFDPALAARLRTVLEAGDTRDAMELYMAFRGRPPSTAALLRGRELASAAAMLGRSPRWTCSPRPGPDIALIRTSTKAIRPGPT